MTVVTLEDGTELLMNPILFDVKGGVENSLRGSGMVEGARVGSGYISWGYQSLGAGLLITVTP